ncbi:hypothetical protein D3C71_1857290 [compost metagenome]
MVQVLDLQHHAVFQGQGVLHGFEQHVEHWHVHRCADVAVLLVVRDVGVNVDAWVVRYQRNSERTWLLCTLGRRTAQT